MEIISLASGDYWIGDPKYALGDDAVSGLIKEAKEKETNDLFKSGTNIVASGFHHDGVVFIGDTRHDINISSGLVVIVPYDTVKVSTKLLGVAFSVKDSINIDYRGHTVTVGNILVCSPKSIDEADDS